MKKILYNILIIAFIIFPVSIFAKGYISISPSTITIEEGSTKTITITAYNAIGDVTIKSNSTDIAMVDSKFWETGPVGDHETKKGTITVTGIKKGRTTIKINIDGATFDSEDLSGQTKNIKVKVVKNKTTVNNNTFTKNIISFLILLIPIIIVYIILRKKHNSKLNKKEKNR